MQEWMISASVGGALIVAGIVMLITHIRHRRPPLSHPELDEDRNVSKQSLRERQEDEWLERGRFRRRVQVAILLILIGVMIPFGDIAIDWKRHEMLFGFYWLAVLLIALWVLMLGLSDFTATFIHTKARMAEIESRQKMLQEQLNELHRQENAERPTSE